MLYLYYFLLSVLFLAMLWWLGFMWETLQSSRKDRVLYHGSNLREQGPVLEEIIRTYCGNTTQNYTLIEPGAGLAKMSQYLAKRFPWKRVEAIEIGLFITILAKLRRPTLKIIRQNLFEYNYPTPSVIYCYLFPQLLDKLYLQGSFQNNLVISLTFPISQVEPTATYPLKSWQKRLYVYDFR